MCVGVGNSLGPVDAAQQFQIVKIQGELLQAAPGVKIKLIFKCAVAPFCLSALSFGSLSLCKAHHITDAFQ